MNVYPLFSPGRLSQWPREESQSSSCLAGCLRPSQSQTYNQTDASQGYWENELQQIYGLLLVFLKWELILKIFYGSRFAEQTFMWLELFATSWMFPKNVSEYFLESILVVLLVSLTSATSQT